MPAVNPGEIWSVDFGLVAKVRPALLLTGNPAVEDLDLVTVLLHTTSLRGNRWEFSILKPFLKPGAFHLQQIQSVSTVKLERNLGVLTGDEMNRVLDALAERLRIVKPSHPTSRPIITPSCKGKAALQFFLRLGVVPGAPRLRRITARESEAAQETETSLSVAR